ncbi:MAG: ROK family protein, partial [Alphaproteobacteria bacterium]|nr:ROK family protein [Alphaproteobacteria bacterium]
SLSRATVNNIVQALRDQGTVEYEWKNRREALVGLSSARGAIISIMVHDMAVQACLFDFAQQTRLDLSSGDLVGISAPESSPAVVLALARRLIDGGAGRGVSVAGVAIAIEGPIEKSTGAIARWAWQRLPHWKGLNLREYFMRHLRLPVLVENDANLAAFAEWTWGVGRRCNHFVHITCGEGIGGGIILNGEIYQGGSGLAGEIGHMVIEEQGTLCFCGSRGCLSGFATERAILAALRDSEKSRNSLSEVVDSARHGDAACQRVLFEAGVHLGKALATVVRVMGPDIIAVGGTLATAGDIMFDGLRSCAEIINLRAIAKSPEFLAAGLIEDAPVLGGIAAMLSKLDLGSNVVEPWMRMPSPGIDQSAI